MSSLLLPLQFTEHPDDMRRFVDRAHALGMGVILDVVYNHLGPDGNYLNNSRPLYFSEKHTTDWGQGINFDGPNCAPGPRILPRECRLLDSRVSSGWAASGRHAGHP